MQGITFTNDFRVIQLGGYDLILGADWMWEHSPVTFDLKDNSITILKGGEEIKLQGNQTKHDIKMMTAKGLENYLCKNPHGIMVQILAINAEVKQEEIHEGIMEVLNKFEGVFTEPKGLPPRDESNMKSI